MARKHIRCTWDFCGRLEYLDDEIFEAIVSSNFFKIVKKRDNPRGTPQ